VQSEYGWDDERVLDLPVCRLRQIIANVESRRKSLRLYNNTITEWQTRTLAQFIAATVPEGGKALQKEAAKIRLRVEDEKGSADDDTPMEKYIEEGSQVADNAVGSYERLMQGFGGIPGA